MADINPTMPSVGEANSTADPKVLSALNTIVSTINTLDADNLASNAITEAKITDGVVSAAKIKSEAWTAYTPSLTNATLGNGTVTGDYIRYGRLIVCRGLFSLGSTSAVSSSPTVSLPATCAEYTVGTVIYSDASVARLWVGSAFAQDAGSVLALYGGNDEQQALSSTNPFTWATGDQIRWNFTYEAAS